jgi:hypothetical protein
MSEKIDLREVQRRTYRLMTFEDGLWDLLMGSMFMFLAVYPITRQALGPVWNFVLFMAILAILVSGQFILRRTISTPRVGFAQPRRSRKMRVLLVGTVVLVLITTGLVVATLLGRPEGSAAPSAPAAPAGRGYLVEWIVLFLLGAVFSGLAYLFGVRRLFAYGWLLGLGYLASVYMEQTAGWTFLLPQAVVAGIIMITGTVLLIRFLRQYPGRAEAV